MGGQLFPFRAELGPRLIQCGLGRALLSYQVASLSIQPFGHNKQAKNWVVVGVPSVLVVAGSRSNTKSPGPRPTSIPSCILIYAAIWPQRIWAENWGAVTLWGRGSWVPI